MNVSGRNGSSSSLEDASLLLEALRSRCLQRSSLTQQHLPLGLIAPSCRQENQRQKEVASALVLQERARLYATLELLELEQTIRARKRAEALLLASAEGFPGLGNSQSESLLEKLALPPVDVRLQPSLLTRNANAVPVPLEPPECLRLSEATEQRQGSVHASSQSSTTASVVSSVHGLQDNEATKYDRTWKARLDELKEYKLRHGHTYVSQSSLSERRLAGWVKTQRYQKKLLDLGRPSPMTPERIWLLEQIDFDWNPRPAREDQLWMTRYKELLSFHRRHGHTRVPQKSKTQRQLGMWVTNQRRQYRRLKEGKKSHMTDRRIEYLSQIDFDWDPMDHDSKTQSKVFSKVCSDDDESGSISQ